MQMDENLDLDLMNASELRALLDRINRAYDELLQREPPEEDSEEYEAWEDSLEELDDLIDDIGDQLENRP